MNAVTYSQPGRQGDVVLVKVDTIPPGFVDAPRDNIGRIVLAYGERSGHAHAIRDKGVCGFRIDGAQDVDYVLVGGSGATLAHEYESGQLAEHEPLTLDAGAYRVVRQREYVAPQIERRAAD